MTRVGLLESCPVPNYLIDVFFAEAASLRPARESDWQIGLRTERRTITHS